MNASIAQAAHQNLIPVFQAEIGGILTNACDARTLHKFLEVTTRFNDWILRRIKYYGFVENQDYVTVLKNEYGENQGFQTIDYTLTLDTGKELSMVEKTEKGRQARKYFIECERIALESMLVKAKTQYGLKQLPPSPYISEAEALQLKKSIAAHCQKTGVANYAELYDKIYTYFRITTYKNIPKGELTKAAQVAGIKLVAVKKPKLKGEEQIIMTLQELQAHDKQVAEEAVKRVQGELMDEPKQQQHNSITITLAPLKEGELMKRYLITHHGDNMVQMWAVTPDTEIRRRDHFIRELKTDGYIVIEKDKLEVATLKQLSALLA